MSGATAPAIGALRSDEHAAAVKLAGEHRHADYAEYRHYGLGFAADLHAHRLERFLAETGAGDVALAARDGGDLVGLAALRPADFESAHFDLAMGQVPFLLARGEGPERTARMRALLGALVEEARRRGLVHLALRLDARDLAALAAAQDRGFRVRDTIVTYLGEARAPHATGMAERHPGFDWDALAGPALRGFDPGRVAHLEDFVRRAFRSDRYHADPHLPDERADALYVEWFRRIFRGEWASGVQLVSRGGRIVGFCSFVEDAEVTRRHGVRIIGRGLAAVLPEGRGGYALLAENIQTRCPVGSRFQEFDTQIQNLAVINVWIRLGMPFLRARSTLHAWLGE